MHGGVKQKDTVRLYFAVQQKHMDEGLGEFLYATYGPDIHIIPFAEITRGNLDTAYQSVEHMENQHDELLLLDADNKYNHNNFDIFLRTIPYTVNAMAITCFKPTNISVPNKWANVKLVDGDVAGIKEKDNSWSEYPALIGTFYFANTEYFKQQANMIMRNKLPVGFRTAPEYYVSMVPMQNLNVYAHEVTDVVPLGTPDDVRNFQEVV
jgi:hypothetical protein